MIVAFVCQSAWPTFPQWTVMMASELNHNKPITAIRSVMCTSLITVFFQTLNQWNTQRAEVTKYIWLTFMGMQHGSRQAGRELHVNVSVRCFHIGILHLFILEDSHLLRTKNVIKMCLCEPKNAASPDLRHTPFIIHLDWATLPYLSHTDLALTGKSLAPRILKIISFSLIDASYKALNAPLR